MQVTLTHKSYGTVYAEAEDFNSSEPMMWITCKTPQILPKQGSVKRLKVGKGAIKEKSQGYLPKHRHLSLTEQYIPLANSIAAKMYRADNNSLDYEELQSLAYLGLVKAANRFEGDIRLFPTVAREYIEGEVLMHWRSEAKTNGTFAYDGDWDEIMTPEETVDNEHLEKVERAVASLRPRLRDIIRAMYLTTNPRTAPELAYVYNISARRINQLKQEGIETLKETLK